MSTGPSTRASERPGAAPAARAIIAEQFRLPIMSARREAALVAALAVFVGAGLLLEGWQGGRAMPFHPDPFALPALLMALLVPLVLWKDQRGSSADHFWALPVGHGRHALLRIAAGWAWTILLLMAAMLGLLVIALATGGSFGANEQRLVATGGEAATAAQGVIVPMPEAHELRLIHFTTPWWQWAAPFVGATALYLFGSALALWSRHPWRWVIGITVAFLLVANIAAELQALRWLNDAMVALLIGPYGLETLVTGYSDTVVQLAGTEGLSPGDLPGTRVSRQGLLQVWRGIPSPGRWAATAALWLGSGALALWAAGRRLRGR